MPESSAARPLSYRPSAYYWRKSLRESTTRDEAVAVGLTLCTELELLKAWVREQGLIPPRFNATAAEAEDKWARDAHADAAEPPPSPG